jgi:hypothetical protein
MIILNRKIPLKIDEPLIIVPFGDIHHDVLDCDRDRFDSLIQWLIEKKKDKHRIALLGMGDYIDSFSTSERDALVGAKGGSGLHDSSLEMLDRALIERTEELYQKLYPLKDDIIGLLEGHHYGVFSRRSDDWKGKTTTEFLCYLLGVPYLGLDADIMVDTCPLTALRIYATHGYGSGKTPGGRLNKRVHMRDTVGDAHLYLMGHDHVKMAYSQTVFVRNARNEETELKQYFCATGSFLKTYRFGSAQGTYIETGAPPADLGVIMCNVRLEKRYGKARLDYHVSV